jgi:hypothetical protein
MSDEEEVFALPLKRRRVCPKIPYVFRETIVYGCERCMPLRDPQWVTWVWAGKKLGLPKEITALIGEWLHKSYVKWSEWLPTEEDKRPWRIPSNCVRLLSRFCCDIPSRVGFCYCDPEMYRRPGFWRHGRRPHAGEPELVVYVSSAYQKIDRGQTYDGVPMEYFETL